MPNGRPALSSSVNNGGDYVASRRALLSRYATPWLLALHHQDRDKYSSLLYDICVELTDDVIDLPTDLFIEDPTHDIKVRFLFRVCLIRTNKSVGPCYALSRQTSAIVDPVISKLNHILGVRKPFHTMAVFSFYFRDRFSGKSYNLYTSLFLTFVGSLFHRCHDSSIKSKKTLPDSVSQTGPCQALKVPTLTHGIIFL